MWDRKMEREGRMTKSQLNNMRRSRKRKENKKKKEEDEEEQKGPTICLFVQHGHQDIGHSMYLMHPLKDINFETSPVLRVPLKEGGLLFSSAFVNLASKFYFFGGYNADGVQVQAFDTKRPNLGLYNVASTHTPKETPCVFVADGMIYALGRPFQLREKPFLAFGKKVYATGYFERYDPNSDQWQVLPDPPSFHYVGSNANTVVGRRVFVGPNYGIFNLDSLDWDPTHYPTNLYNRFPYGSIYDEHQHSLYYLCGIHDYMFTKDMLVPHHDIDRSCDYIKVVKRGPLPSPLPNDNQTFLQSSFLDCDNRLFVASDSDLDDPAIFFSHKSFYPWRKLFHMGGCIFCYVVTAQLVDCDPYYHTLDQPNSRGVWIKFFQEVDGKFRTLASFCYEINTDFDQRSLHIHLSVFGSFPQSWIKDPPGNNTQKCNIFRHNPSDIRMSILMERGKEIMELAAILLNKEEDLKAKERALSNIRSLTKGKKYYY